MRAVRADQALPGTVGPTVAQLLAEELVTEMVRRQIDVIGLLELEREVFESVGGIADDLGASPQTIPAAALAATLIDQAFKKVEAEWRQQRNLCSTDECVCCAMELASRERRRNRRGGAGEGGEAS
ncbi:MAG: hypothetical protein K8M05_23700 [Deltaproteobacteria bacterium]|nr:hypothetical protein [Kofleriaceae bacterium]